MSNLDAILDKYFGSAVLITKGLIPAWEAIPLATQTDDGYTIWYTTNMGRCYYSVGNGWIGRHKGELVDVTDGVIAWELGSEGPEESAHKAIDCA